MATRIRKGDTVEVISGGDKGTRGEVLQVQGDMVLVAGINLVKRHRKPTRVGEEGGIIEKEMPVDISNVMVVDPKTDKPTRLRAGKDKDGNKARVAVKSGSVL